MNCTKCGVLLAADNWPQSRRKRHHYLCNHCETQRVVKWRKEHPDAYKEQGRKRWLRDRGNDERKRYQAAWMRDARARKEAENVAKVGHGNPERIYYAYELYTILPNGVRHVYYIGKGKGDRVYNHEKLYRRKLKSPRPELDCKEKAMLLFEDMGCTLYTNIIMSGLSEDEAFNLEREEILAKGLHTLTNVAPPHRPRITQAPHR